MLTGRSRIGAGRGLDVPFLIAPYAVRPSVRPPPPPPPRIGPHTLLGSAQVFTKGCARPVAIALRCRQDAYWTDGRHSFDQMGKEKNQLPSLDVSCGTRR